MTKQPDNVSNDYNYSRQTYYDLIEKGKESLLGKLKGIFKK